VLTATFDRWLLQTQAGSIEQGLYSFAYGLMGVGYIFLNAIQPLMVREMSIAAAQLDFARMKHLYQRFFPPLFAVTAYFCAFLFVEADNLIVLFGGSEYSRSALSFRVLTLFPMLTVIAGLNAAFVYATQRTRWFLILSSIFTPLGSALLYLLIAHHLLNLGALGLSLKIIILNGISVVILTRLITRILDLSFWKLIGHFLFVTGYLMVACACHLYMQQWIKAPLPHFLVSGLIYTAIMALLIWISPRIFGLNHSQIEEITALVSKRKASSP
jgi:O-antigen/teichoic acid export membrane protein